MRMLLLMNLAELDSDQGLLRVSGAGYVAGNLIKHHTLTLFIDQAIWASVRMNLVFRG
jgi:hypothetical protein